MLAVFAALFLLANPLSKANAQSETSGGSDPALLNAIVDWTALTNSPASTIRSFNRLTEHLEQALLQYEVEKTPENRSTIYLVASQIGSLYDLSQVSKVSQAHTAHITTAAMLDVFNRIGKPDPSLAPSAADLGSDNGAAYSIPETPFRIVLQADGPRTGEWIFEARTVTASVAFLEGISTLPLKSDQGIQNWSDLLQQITGPAISQRFVAAIPTVLKQPFLGLPIWKAIAVVLSFVILFFLVNFWLRMLPDLSSEDAGSRAYFFRVLGPIGANFLVYTIYSWVSYQLALTGMFSLITDIMVSAVYWIIFAWGFWRVTSAISEFILERQNVAEGIVDANMIRLSSGVFGIVGCVIILAFGAQTIGVPILSVLAGLGIGGVAVALAVRPTLENLIGGIILFLDKPIRVGEYGSFGDKSGTV